MAGAIAPPISPLFLCKGIAGMPVRKGTASGRIDSFQSIRPLNSLRPMDHTSLFSFFFLFHFTFLCFPRFSCTPCTVTFWQIPLQQSVTLFVSCTFCLEPLLFIKFFNGRLCFFLSLYCDFIICPDSVFVNTFFAIFDYFFEIIFCRIYFTNLSCFL